MDDLLKFLNDNSGALSVIFTGVVTLATAVYAALTWQLVSETRRMRKVQTEPKLEITLRSIDEATHIQRLHLREALNKWVSTRSVTIQGRNLQSIFEPCGILYPR